MDDELRLIMKKFHLQPNKVMGQNFLVDSEAIRQVLVAAEISPRDIVLEVGPGTGVITYLLAKKVKRVVAVEKDPKLADFLQREFKNYKNIEIVKQDILQADFSQLGLQKQNYKIVSNLPFYLSNYFLRKIMEQPIKPTEMVLLLQQEVGDRIVAKGNKESILSIMMKVYARSSFVAKISKKSFYPTPKVDTALVKFLFYKEPKINARDIGVFTRVVKAGFSSKRRQIHNSLEGGLGLDKSLVGKLLQLAKIDSVARAEDLKFADWIKLTDVYKSEQNTLTL